MDACGFDFTGHVRHLIEDMVERLPELSHIDPARIALSFCQARNRSRYGLYATLTPMRFRHGRLTTTRRGQPFTVQRLFNPSGQELLYIVSFYLPRFLDLDLNEKLVTILHELWHISPDFDGDVRRHAGRCYAHSHSQHEYDAAMQTLANRWLAQAPPTELYDFLQLDFATLRGRFGRIYGTKIPHPKLLPCPFVYRPSSSAKWASP